MQARLGRIVGGIAAIGFVITFAPVVRAATWAGGTTPAPTQIFAIDATGEPGWLYGAEDVAGDGLDVFQQQEKSIDIRTAYAATDSSRLWLRVYVSDPSAAGGNIDAYFFIDSDHDPSTGGTAAATDIDPKFTTDSTSGGYEYVVGVRGNRTVVGLWEWTSAWTTKNYTPAQITAEASSDIDPIRVNGDTHGYLQASVELALVGLTQACDASLYVRTTNDSPSGGEGDLNVGDKGSCVPADSNQNGVPDPIENTQTGCTDNSQCPNGGVCVDGACKFSAACVTEADCQSGYTCTNGRCVIKPTGTCSTTADCSNNTVCEGGQCVACTSDAQCGSGAVCGSDGRCTGTTGGGGPCRTDDDCGSGEFCRKNPPNAATGTCGPYDLENRPEGEELKGGACTCGVPGGPAGHIVGLLLAFPALLGWRRARRRQRHSSIHRDR